jgi:hypothetical protein
MDLSLMAQTSRIKAQMSRFEDCTKYSYATEAMDYGSPPKTLNIPIPPILKPDENWVKSNENKSEAFAHHFSGVNLIKSNQIKSSLFVLYIHTRIVSLY